jgi:hypothetical protein
MGKKRLSLHRKSETNVKPFKQQKNMKKLFLSLVTLFVMSANMMAQSVNDSTANSITFERMSSYLNLTIDQMDPVKTAIAQFEVSMDYFNKLKDSEKTWEAANMLVNRHKATMRRILNDKQYNLYVDAVDRTIQNRVAQYE